MNWRKLYRMIAAHVAGSYFSLALVVVVHASAPLEWSVIVWLLLCAAPVATPIWLAFITVYNFAWGANQYWSMLLTGWLGYLCAAAVAYAAVGRTRRVQTRRVLTGLCGWCGYDVRNSPGRCPECGNERLDYLRYEN